MAGLVLVHGGGDSGWYWHLVEGELRRRGHETAAPDLPETEATLQEYVDTVAAAAPAADGLVVGG